ncbi:MAG: N-6 DNA methylase, partial [Aquihabitans sp.]
MAELGLMSQDDSPSIALAGIAAATVWGATGRSVPSDLRAAGIDSAMIETPQFATGLVGSPATPGLIGVLYEAGLADEVRSSGVHYTPPNVAARLVSLVGLSDHPGASGRSAHAVWDPACGGGAFLLAAADALHQGGQDPAHIVEHLLWGTDIDPGAIAVAEAALVLWATEHGVPDARPGAHLHVGDGLLNPVVPAGGFHWVVGNPPFQGQLTGGVVRSGDTRAALRDRWGDVVGPYTDTAALFLVAAVEALAPGGRATLVLPTSILAARDAAGCRAAVAAAADLTDMWVATESVFDADVDVWAPVLVKRGGSAPEARPVRRWRGLDFAALPDAPETSVAGSTWHRTPGASWSPLALTALGVPDPAMRSSGTISDIATTSAAFRDEYYGLVEHVREGPEVSGTEPWVDLTTDLSPLITSGLVDPGRCRWGSRPARFARQRFDRPVVNIESLRMAGGPAANWVGATAGPKVVVATQTRVGEAAVDEQ